MDYVLLADHLDIISEEEKYTYSMVNLDDEKISKNYAIQGHDISYVLLRRFLERENFFSSLGKFSNIAFDGLMGKLDYHPTFREYKFRIQNLKKLQKNKIPFPNNWGQFMETVGRVRKACFLNNIHNEELHKKGSERIGTHMVNPAAQYLYLEDENTFEKMIGVWNRYLESAKARPDWDTYK